MLPWRISSLVTFADGTAEKPQTLVTSSLYYKPITIVNDNSSIVNKLETSHIDDARVIIYNFHMFKVQATGARPLGQPPKQT